MWSIFLRVVYDLKLHGMDKKEDNASHLACEALLSTVILWIISTYCSYVWKEKVQNGNNYSICVDKLRSVRMQEYQQNLISQNPLAFIPF